MDELETFALELFRNGVYVLGCGGGVIAEPGRAVRSLRSKYGIPGLIRRCLELLLEPQGQRHYPEGSCWTAYGVIYHTGDESLVRQLIDMRQARLGNAAQAECLATLIAGLCSRLGLPLPEGISALDPMEECHLFNEGDTRIS